ncbi:hypothetical protein HOLleu_23949 [Holothuria leucospilota]|uniref:Uncharacterized protein n=1 Tax=Holothuria leucospilota TaxID=206669 RepID=A0A9Q1BW07_HOLLE|nr:hypothetical protein HOLleu_23949 [Holothuria leucospilota]
MLPILQGKLYLDILYIMNPRMQLVADFVSIQARNVSTNAPIVNDTQGERNQVANQSTTEQPIHEPFSSKEDMRTNSTTYQQVPEISTDYTNTKQGTKEPVIIGPSSSTTTLPQPNMIYTNSIEGRGYTKASILSMTEAERNRSTYQSNIRHSTYEPYSSKQNTSTDNQGVQTVEDVLARSFTYTTANKGSNNPVTTGHPIFTTATPPTNTAKANSIRGQGMC